MAASCALPSQSDSHDSTTIRGIQAVLLDIEGTTTPITFVKDKLFPLARRELRSYLTANWNKTECKNAVAALCAQACADKAAGIEGVPLISDNPLPEDDTYPKSLVENVVKNVLWQMDSDRKATPLKQLQGQLWQNAYEDGKIKGQLFADFLPALKQWKSDGLGVYIYSSGSVHAQKLLFRYSEQGDLLQFIDGHFDTKIGNKRVKSSYTSIADELGVAAKTVLFCTDIIQEADAARSAAMQVAILSRPGNAPLSEEDHARHLVCESLLDLTVVSSKSEPSLPAEEQKAQDTNDTDQASRQQELMDTGSLQSAAMKRKLENANDSEQEKKRQKL